MLKQSSHENRILFLKFFTRELILNSKPKPTEQPVEKTEKELVEKEITKPIPEKLIPSVMPAKQIKTEKKQDIKQITAPLEIRKKIRVLQKPGISAPAVAPTAPPTISVKPEIQPIQPEITALVSDLPKIEGANLGRLNMFLSDKAITEIECPGPNKFILVKKAGQINLTKITLTQEEISVIIKSFSKKARIPVIGGVFKASVGNLTILAVISEFVGSRFVIYKAGPYSLIERQTQQLQQAQLQARLQQSKKFLKSQ